MIYKYSQLTKRRKYTDSKIYKERKVYHFGQLKLLFSEIMFLTKYADNGNKVLYVGAASGYHIALLADLFPFLEFDLWDPAKFNIEEKNNIHKFNRFFTTKDAENYKKEGKNILFISDIRNLDIQHVRKDITKLDRLVDDDMDKQMNWVKIINPKSAYLKFRLPYSPGNTKYFAGTVYLQIFSPESTETRLLVNNYNKMKTYDHTEFDEKLAYFNCCIRGSDKSYKRWSKILDKYNLKNDWDTTMALYVVHYYLNKIKNIKSDEETGKLFMKLLNYHIKDNEKKYRNLFTK